jgi:hypothetical protein
MFVLVLFFIKMVTDATHFYCIYRVFLGKFTHSQPSAQSCPLFPQPFTKPRVSVVSVAGQQHLIRWTLKVHKGSLSWSEGMHVVLTKGKIGQVGTAVPVLAFRANVSDTEVIVEFSADARNVYNLEDLSKISTFEFMYADTNYSRGFCSACPLITFNTGCEAQLAQPVTVIVEPKRFPVSLQTRRNAQLKVASCGTSLELSVQRQLLSALNPRALFSQPTVMNAEKNWLLLATEQRRGRSAARWTSFAVTCLISRNWSHCSCSECAHAARNFMLFIVCHSDNHLNFSWKSVPLNYNLAVPLLAKISDWQSAIECASLSQTMRVIDPDSDDPKLEWSIGANAAYGLGSFPATTTQIQLIFPEKSWLAGKWFPYTEIVLKSGQTPCVLDPYELSQPLKFSCSFADIETVPNYRQRLKDLQFR